MLKSDNFVEKFSFTTSYALFIKSFEMFKAWLLAIVVTLDI
jgi:hypothetical protein